MRHMSSVPRGFSLLEVMISMAVLATGLLAMTPVVSLAIQRGAHARKMTAAQHLAQDLLERLRAEIRYDGGLASEPLEREGWSFNFLPHNPLAGEATDCQENGMADGIPYNHGPLYFVRETHEFTVCYALEHIAPTVPELSGETTEILIRVSWPNASGGYSSWSLSDLLVSGA